MKSKYPLTVAKAFRTEVEKVNDASSPIHIECITSTIVKPSNFYKPISKITPYEEE